MKAARVVSVAVVLMAYGSPERIEDVPAYYSDIRGGRPIRPELLEELTRALPAARDRGLEPAERDHRADARRARAGARAARLHRDEALDAADRRRGRDRARGRGRDDRRARARAALLADVDRRLPRAAAGGARRPRRAALRRELARRRGARRPLGRAAPRNRRARRLHRALAARADPRPRATRTRISCSRPRG